MISGLTIIRNGIKYDYPFLESIQSLLSICDEVIIVAGNSDDETNEAIRSLKNDKVKFINTVWDENLRTGGKILAQQTNIGIQAIKGDWIVYLQGDEVLHENAAAAIKAKILEADQIKSVDGLLFPYFHFYGGYNYIKTSRSAYRFEIRAFKNNGRTFSYKDAQGFRIYESFEHYLENENAGEKLKVIKVDSPIYHYGYVKPPEIMQLKAANFHKLWHSDEKVKEMLGDNFKFDYSQYDQLEIFEGEHPAIMLQKVKHQDWKFVYDPNRSKTKLKYKILMWIEKHTGVRLFEYKNYQLIQ